MTDRPLLPGEHAILGLLATRPMHGYEMARTIANEDLAAVCPVEQSLLYTYLRNLQDRGLVRWHERRVGNRPPRKMFELTPTGRAELDRWLTAPVSRIREIRLDFLLKLYFLDRSDPAAERALLSQQIHVCQAYERALLAGAEGPPGFGRVVARSKLSAAQATLHWLREYLHELDEQREELHAPASL